MSWLLLLLGLLEICGPLRAGEGPETLGLALVLKVNKGTYAQGEPIALTLEVVNRGPGSVSLRFRDAQRYDAVIQDLQGRPIWRWSAGRMFAQALGEKFLEPAGGKLSYRITVRDRFPPGRYTVIGVIPAEGGQITANMKIRIR